MLVRFVAACCMAFGLVELALCLAEHKYRAVPLNPFLIALWVMLLLAGVVLLVRARAVAEWMNDWLE